MRSSLYAVACAAFYCASVNADLAYLTDSSYVQACSIVYADPPFVNAFQTSCQYTLANQQRYFEPSELRVTTYADALTPQGGSSNHAKSVISITFSVTTSTEVDLSIGVSSATLNGGQCRSNGSFFGPGYNFTWEGTVLPTRLTLESGTYSVFVDNDVESWALDPYFASEAFQYVTCTITVVPSPGCGILVLAGGISLFRRSRRATLAHRVHPVRT